MSPEELAREVLRRAEDLLSKLPLSNQPPLTGQARDDALSEIEKLSKLIDGNVISPDDSQSGPLWGNTITPVNGVGGALGPLATSIEDGFVASDSFEAAIRDLRGEIAATQKKQDEEPKAGYDD
jgi:hypothetical protein